ncbi:hypothetical protein LVR82_19415 [Klebsiella variicola subsp. variicola]|uniref:hypothetical protein n=1 Tax=Klebsiella variicola TaxID=244366 RepID=UPI001E4D2B8F|nr:hypothetical protein [Klebsiella variicola]MCD9775844.1 hypothetical protein [Klebsiella variicola subsp. variicola]
MTDRKSTAAAFIYAGKVELYKRLACSYLANLPKERGQVVIPNTFMDEFLKEDFDVSDFNEILSIFREASNNG